MIDVGDRNTKDRFLNKTDESRKSPKGGNIKIDFTSLGCVYLHGKPLPIFQGSAHVSSVLSPWQNWQRYCKACL